MLHGFILLDHMGFVAESDIRPGTSEVVIPLDFDDYPLSSILGTDVLAALEEQPPISPVPPFNDETGTTASIQHALDKARAEWFSQAMAIK
jgi:hypothetical protein